MDMYVKKGVVYQVLFNKPLCLTKNKLIYGFRIKENELEHKPLSEKRLLEYIVEGIFGKCLFQEIHKGSFTGENDMIWIDQEENEYQECSDQTSLYSYDVTVANNMNFRCDLVYMDCENDEGDDYWITDPQDYFDCRAKMDADDHRLGKNQWMENDLRIKSRMGVLSDIAVNRGENLDYNKQEIMRIFACEEA